MNDKPPLIRSIEKITGLTLFPAFGIGYDPALSVMAHHEQKPRRYLLNEEGELIGLNLGGAIITDTMWLQILAIPEFKPEKLEALNLRECTLTVSPVTPDMTALRHLDLSRNNIKEFRPPTPLALEHILLYGNELTSPPLEIVQQGKDAILNYHQKLQEEGATKIYEAKVLIVGSGGVGKTTLLRRLLQKDKAIMPREEESTHGIEVHDMKPFDCGGEHPFRAHIWDFGGQEIYHATHQFFLTKRSLYVLVTDPRKEDTDFEYWLQIIQLLGEDSPVIIVQNEKAGRTKDNNIPGLRAQFKNIQPVSHSLDLSKKDELEKLDALIFDIQTQLGNLPHIGETLPNSWAKVRQELEKERTKNPVIPAERFIQICAKHGENDGDALRLSQYLHDLGFLLHFQDDPILKHSVILENSWATEGVYAVLDHNPIKQDKKGKFSSADAKAIWDQKVNAAGQALFKGRHDELLRLMLKFEICYQLQPPQADYYISPQLLPAAEPVASLEWRQEESLHLIFRYEFMPKGMMSRLIVRLNHYIQHHQEDAWQSGAILHRNEHQQARMVATNTSRDIHISVLGHQAKELLTIIAEEVDRLNSSYEKIKVNKLVPCICSECRHYLKNSGWQNQDTVTLFPYKVLENAQLKKEEALQCQKSFEQVNVLRLIESISNATFFSQKALQVFVSYFKTDLEHLHQLKKHLTSLVRAGQLNLWYDLDMLPGDEKDKTTHRQLASADIIILLVSADFLAAEHAWEEIKMAIERHEKAGTLIVPVIVRPCNFKDAPFAKFRALPTNEKPITKWEDQDEAWLEVVEQLTRLSKKLKH